MFPLMVVLLDFNTFLKRLSGIRQKILWTQLEPRSGFALSQPLVARKRMLEHLRLRRGPARTQLLSRRSLA